MVSSSFISRAKKSDSNQPKNATETLLKVQEIQQNYQVENFLLNEEEEPAIAVNSSIKLSEDDGKLSPTSNYDNVNLEELSINLSAQNPAFFESTEKPLGDSELKEEEEMKKMEQMREEYQRKLQENDGGYGRGQASFGGGRATAFKPKMVYESSENQRLDSNFENTDVDGEFDDSASNQET